MLFKLSLGNAKRSVKDYLIYIVTITIAFSLMFSFNLISNSKDILDLADMMKNFRIAMIFVSLIVCFVLGFLINYMIKFIFKRRSKEFGLYLLLGISKKDISLMFILENLILGFISLVLSFFVGILLSTIISSIILNIFNAPYLVKLPTDYLVPILLSLGYFLLIYLVVLLLTKRRIKRLKIHDLLYLDSHNEKSKVTKKKSIVTFIISLILVMGGLLIFNNEFKGVGIEPDTLLVILSIIMLIGGIYLFISSFADFLLAFVLKHKTLKYNKDNLFVMRQFNAKVKTMKKSLGTLSLLITLTLVSLTFSLMFNKIFDIGIDMSAPYDVTIIDDEENFDKYINHIKKEYTIDEVFTYHEYFNDVNYVNDNLSYDYQGWRGTDTYLRVSDYNKLLELKGRGPITLKDNEYYIHSSSSVYDGIMDIKDKLKTIKVGDKTLKLKDVTSLYYTSSWSYGNGFIIVVPDNIVDNLKSESDTLVVDTKEETKEELNNELLNILDDDICERDPETGATYCYASANVFVKGYYLAMNKSVMTIMDFTLFYLAFIFTVVTGTIISVQSINDGITYKKYYDTLNKLGLSKRNILKTVRKQLLIYFLFPVILPFIINFFITTSLNHVFSAFLPTSMTYLSFIFLSSILFLSIYLIYYLISYFSFKRCLDY